MWQSVARQCDSSPHRLTTFVFPIMPKPPFRAMSRIQKVSGSREATPLTAQAGPIEKNEWLDAFLVTPYGDIAGESYGCFIQIHFRAFDCHHHCPTDRLARQIMFPTIMNFNLASQIIQSIMLNSDSRRLRAAGPGPRPASTPKRTVPSPSMQ
jgi:hypothetical protein